MGVMDAGLQRNALTALFATALLITGGCRTLPPTAATSAALSAAELSTTEYRSGWTASGKAPLENGLYAEPSAPGSFSETLVRLTGFGVVGTLKGVGEGAAVILVTQGGGSGTYYDLAVVVRRDGMPVNIATAALGDRVRVNSLSLREGVIIVEMVTHAVGDPMAAPTRLTVRRFSLEGDRLVEEGGEGPAAR